MKWVPISFCQFCIENKCTDAGKLFCYLKYESDGITDKSLLVKAQRYFSVSERTVRRWLKTAERFNWIGRNGNTFFIRGWQYLFDSHLFQKKSCYRFQKKDLKRFKTFCYAAVMSYMARVQIVKMERKSGRSFQSPIWAPLASSAISKTLGVSQRTAQRYRKKAVQTGFIEKKANLKPSPINVSEINDFRKYSSLSDKNLVVKHGKVFEQLPDVIKYDKNSIHTVRRLKKRIAQGTRNSMYAKSVHQFNPLLSLSDLKGEQL